MSVTIVPTLLFLLSTIHITNQPLLQPNLPFYSCCSNLTSCRPAVFTLGHSFHAYCCHIYRYFLLPTYPSTHFTSVVILSHWYLPFILRRGSARASLLSTSAVAVINDVISSVTATWRKPPAGCRPQTPGPGTTAAASHLAGRKPSTAMENLILSSEFYKPILARSLY